MACKACIKAKAKCVRPRVGEMEVAMKWKKTMEGESLRGKRKRAHRHGGNGGECGHPEGDQGHYEGEQQVTQLPQQLAGEVG